MTATYYQTSEMTTVCCGECGISFGLPTHFYDKRRETGETFWCPNGHGRAFRETEKMRLEKELAREKSKSDQLKADVDWQKKRRNEAEKSLIATKGVVTRLKNRARNGVCPCCIRTFKDLHMHMASEHPNFVTDEELKSETNSVAG